MDREAEDLQFLGLFGIYREAYNIICSWKNILSQITLWLIIPTSFIFLAQIEISHYLFINIMHTERILDHTTPHSHMYNSIHSRITSEWAIYYLFKGAYYLFLLIFSLLSTSAVVYTVACAYTSKHVSFTKVMSVVPKVWKRLMVTFVWTFVLLFVYNLVAFLIFMLSFAFFDPDTFVIPLLIFLCNVYVVGFVYLSLVWHLASVVSVLEDIYGIKAMIKAKNLIKGKIWVACAIFLKLHASFVAILIAFQLLVVHGGHRSYSLLTRTAYGIMCVLLLSLLMHLGLVIQTVIYFVCKSYHHENIDKSCLADHLEVYLGDYAPLKERDVQLEQFHV